jgi:hypothetical protein
MAVQTDRGLSNYNTYLVLHTQNMGGWICPSAPLDTRSVAAWFVNFPSWPHYFRGNTAGAVGKSLAGPKKYLLPSSEWIPVCPFYQQAHWLRCPGSSLACSHNNSQRRDIMNSEWDLFIHTVPREALLFLVQGGSNMTGTNCDLFILTNRPGHIWTTL